MDPIKKEALDFYQSQVDKVLDLRMFAGFTQRDHYFDLENKSPIITKNQKKITELSAKDELFR